MSQTYMCVGVVFLKVTSRPWASSNLHRISTMIG